MGKSKRVIKRNIMLFRSCKSKSSLAIARQFRKRIYSKSFNISLANKITLSPLQMVSWLKITFKLCSVDCYPPLKQSQRIYAEIGKPASKLPKCSKEQGTSNEIIHLTWNITLRSRMSIVLITYSGIKVAKTEMRGQIEILAEWSLQGPCLSSQWNHHFAWKI